MQTLSEVVLVNSVTAALLALVATVLSRWTRRPAILHALWLVVLLKLVTPPILRVEALPVFGALSSVPVQTVESATTLPSASLSSARLSGEATGAPRISPAGIAGWAWFGASAFLLGLVVVRCARFRRLVGNSTPAPPSLQRRAEWLAERMSLRRCPTLRLIEGRLPPMLWWRAGPAELLLPTGLLRRLDPTERDALIVHELAHVRRRDHWVRWVETTVIVLFWWNPVSWWARRNLRIAEEKSCDAWVLALLPGASRSYAEAILKTLDYISGAGSRIPILATGAAETRHLKERLTMIMSRKRPLRTRLTQRWALALLALALLFVFPTSQQGTAAASGADDVAQDPSYRQALLAMEHEALELEYRLSRLQAERMEIEQEIERQMVRAKLDALRQHSEQLRLEGREKEAAMLEKQFQEQERRRDLEVDRLNIELEHQAQMRRREFDMQRAALALEEARLSDDPARAEALELKVRQLDLDMRRAALDDLRRREELEQESLEALELETLAERPAEEAEQQRRYLALDRSAAQLLAKLDALERAGASADAEQTVELEQAARELRHLLEKLERERRHSGVR